MPNFLQNPLATETAVISTGSALSSAVNLGGLRLFGFVMPSAWTAADISFQASYDGGLSWSNMYDDVGEEMAASVSAARCVILDPIDFAAVPMIRLRSGTESAPITQEAERAITLVLRSV